MRKKKSLTRRTRAPHSKRPRHTTTTSTRVCLTLVCMCRILSWMCIALTHVCPTLAQACLTPVRMFLTRASHSKKPRQTTTTSARVRLHGRPQSRFAPRFLSTLTCQLLTSQLLRTKLAFDVHVWSKIWSKPWISLVLTMNRVHRPCMARPRGWLRGVR